METLPLRSDVDERNFDAFVESRDLVVVLVYDPRETDDDGLQRLATACARNVIPAALAVVPAARATGLLTMLGATGAPYLIVFRDRVALYAERVLPSSQGLGDLLAQVSAIDMDAVRKELEAARLARDALVTRRACPTLRQRRSPD